MLWPWLSVNWDTSLLECVWTAGTSAGCQLTSVVSSDSAVSSESAGMLRLKNHSEKVPFCSRPCFLFNLFLLYLCSFSIPTFDSLIIVVTNNISEQSMAELNEKVSKLKVRLFYNSFSACPDVLYVGHSGE